MIFLKSLGWEFNYKNVINITEWNTEMPCKINYDKGVEIHDRSH
jgi:hypothetical protein